MKQTVNKRTAVLYCFPKEKNLLPPFLWLTTMEK